MVCSSSCLDGEYLYIHPDTGAYECITDCYIQPTGVVTPNDTHKFYKKEETHECVLPVNCGKATPYADPSTGYCVDKCPGPPAPALWAYIPGFICVEDC